MPAVLIADKLPESARRRLGEAGCEVVFDPALRGEALERAIAERSPEVLVVRSTRVQANHLRAGHGLALVVRAGAGVNTIDLAEASARGVYVANCPGRNAAAVAELAWGHILNADRRIADGVADLRAGRWRKREYARARGLRGRTLGILGLGRIGREVAARGLAFGMDVVAWSRSLDSETASELGLRRAADPIQLAGQSDVLSVHVAATPQTRGLVGAALLDAMKPGSILVNTSRGEVVDEQALAGAVRDKGLRVGLDVYRGEPGADGEWRQPLAELPGVYGTHHVGASTEQAQEAVAAEACRIILSYAATGTVPNCVNLARATPATHLLVVRHLDRVGVLAGVLDLLREAGLNVQAMENVIFGSGAPGGAACARIHVVGPPPPEVLEALRARPTLLDVKLVPLEVP